jgi:hypothetical protein
MTRKVESEQIGGDDGARTRQQSRRTESKSFPIPRWYNVNIRAHRSADLKDRVVFKLEWPLNLAFGWPRGVIDGLQVYRFFYRLTTSGVQ